MNDSIHPAIRRAAATLFGVGAAFAAQADSTSLAVGNAAVTAGAGSTTLSFPVTRTGDTSYDAWLSYQTQNGTAVAGTDYTATNGVAKIPAGSSSITIPVTVLANASGTLDKTFSLLLNGALGTGVAPSFGSPTVLTVPSSNLHPLATADFNGDGKPDLVFAPDTTGIYVMLDTTATGTTTASYSAAVAIPGSGDYASVAIADINGDGKPDVVAADRGGAPGKVAVFLNTTAPGATTPSFAAQATFTAQNNPVAIAVGDFNGDGKIDVATSNQSGTIDVFLNTTSAGATTASLGTPLSFGGGGLDDSISVADINGDGKADIVVGNYSASGTLVAFLNTTATGATSASFGAAQSFPVGAQPFDETFTDLNGDGKPDIVTTNFGDNTLSVMINTTAPGSTTASFSTGNIAIGTSGPTTVRAADLNGDGAPDLVVADYTDGNIAVLYNQTFHGATTASFSNRQTFAVGPNSTQVVTADVNGDGRPDVVVSAVSGNAAVLLNTTTAPAAGFNPGFTAQQTFAVGSGLTVVALADINGDGKPDAVAIDEAGNTVYVLLGNTTSGSATPSFGAPIAPAFLPGFITSPRNILVADFNGDGKPDLVIANTSNNQLLAIPNVTAPGATTPSFAPLTPLTLSATPQALAAGDINGDGKLDVVVSFSNNSQSAVLQNNSGGIGIGFTQLAGPLLPSDSHSGVAIADLNGDGKPDVVFTNDFSNTASVAFNTTTGGGSASFGPPQTISQSGCASVQTVALADLNGDGRPDFNFGCGNNAAMRSQINTTASGSTTLGLGGSNTATVGGAPTAIAALDVDGDGKPDLVAAYNGGVQTLHNATAAGATTPAFGAAVSAAAGATTNTGLALADLNGDGKPDLVLARNASIAALANGQFLASTTATTATGTIHGGGDTAPDPFSFTAVSNATVNTVYTSNTITVGGLGGPVVISFHGTGAYKINSGGYTAASGTVGNGDQVTIQLTSSSSDKTTVHGGVNIGTGAGAFFVTTAAPLPPDTTPDAFSFTAVHNAVPGSTVQSNMVTITGIAVAVPVTITGGSYSIGGGAYTTAAGTINNGQTLQIQMTAPGTAQSSVHAVVKVGTTTVPFVVSTAK